MNNRFIEAIARRIAETTPEFKWLKDFFSKTIQRNANVITRGSNTSQGNLAEWGANGDLTDSGHSTNQDLETTSDVKFRSVEAARIDVNRNLTFKRENTVGTTSSVKSGIMLTGLQSPMIDVPAGDDFGFIDSQYFKDGAIIFLKFNGNSTITHKENGAEADNVRLNHNETHTFTNKDFLTLQYDDVVKEWREIGRSSKKPVNGDFVGDSDTQTLTNKTINGNNNSLSNIAQSTIYAEQESIAQYQSGQFTLNPTKRVISLQLGNSTTISSIDTSAFQGGEIFIINNGIVGGGTILLGVGIYMLDEDYYAQFNGNEYPMQDNDIHLFLVIGSGTIKEIARYKAANSQLDNTRINTVSSNYQTKAEDLLKVSSSGTTITVSDYDINQGNAIKIKDTSGAAGSSAITINTQSSQNIDGGSSISINTNYGSAIVQSDGSNVFSF